MAYNPGFPLNYQPYYPTSPNIYQQPTQQQPTQGQSGIIWVSGEAGAKAYLIAPNTTVQLWDSESQTIYLKSADASGMPSMKVLDYVIRDNASTQNAPAINDNVYVTRQEFSALVDRVEKHFADSSKKIKEDKQNE